jgi:hypothetical protein
MTYIYQPYPAWRYHATLPAKIVATAEEDAALDESWVDSPAKLPEPDDDKLKRRSAPRGKPNGDPTRGEHAQRAP